MSPKRRKIKNARSQQGMIMIEVLVAALIVGFNLAALVSMWSFSYHMTTRTDDKGIACNLARQTMEAVKQAGFDNTSEAPVLSPIVHDFDSHEQNQDLSPASARYQVSLSVVSDSLIGGSNPATPSPGALRTVTVTVTLLGTGEIIYQTSTYLVRGGI